MLQRDEVIVTSWTGLHFSIVIVCLLVSAFFSASETALTGASRASMLRLSKQGNREAGVVSSLFGDARADDRRAAARQQHRQYRRLGAGDRHVHGVVRRSRRALRHRRDDGAGRDLRRGVAEDHRHQRAGPGVASGRAPDEADGVCAGAAARRRRGDRAGADDDASASRSATTSRSCRRPSGCAARSICCITKARSKSRTATCSAACWICANCRSPT